MARSQAIPARFWIGFPISPEADEGEVGGYHCWADAFEAGRGWIPFDASEATKSGRHEDYFGTLPSDRVVFTLGRDLMLEPAQDGEPLNFFIYAYAEKGGEALPTPPWSLRYRRVPLGDVALSRSGR